MKTPEKRRQLADMEIVARGIGQAIGETLPKGVGFALLLYQFGEKGYSTYIGNGDRADMVKAFREAADVLEGKLDAPPGVLAKGGDA